jgi:hypothetical protein
MCEVLSSNSGQTTRGKEQPLRRTLNLLNFDTASLAMVSISFLKNKKQKKKKKPTGNKAHY